MLNIGKILASIAVGIPLVAFAFFGTGNGALFGKVAEAGYGGQDKATICHDGKTLTVGEPALSAHIAHGDTEGACVQ